VAYTIIDTNVHREIQYHLLETVNGGSSYASGLYTTSEVVARMNYRLREFNKLTNVVTKRSTSLSTTANVTEQPIPTDAINLIRVGYPDSLGTTYEVREGSALEADMIIADLRGANAAVDLPKVYTQEFGAVLTIDMLPPPNAVRAIDYIYSPQPTLLPDPPNGATLQCPDDFTPFVKFGVLADLFNKSGEAHDPERAALCQSIYELGVKVAQGWVYGGAA